MLRSLTLSNFTAFSNAHMDFVQGLNVILGENGTGKTHLLKLPYSVMAISAEEGRRFSKLPTKAVLQSRIAEKMINVFRPDNERVGRLTRNRPGRNRCEVTVQFRQQKASCKFGFASQSRSEVVFGESPPSWLDSSPAYLPPRELLTIYPGFVSLYESRNVEFEETWRDTCVLLGSPTLRGPGRLKAWALLQSLEGQIGRVVLERSGRFYLRQRGAADMEMPLVAEGWRKLAMLACLVGSGSISRGGVLFWDEPEASLNPKLIRRIAEAILRLCSNGVQIVCATHSLILLREFEILLRSEFSNVEPRYFALKLGEDGVEVSQSDDVSEVDPLVLLDQELEQSDRYVEEMMQ